VAQITFDYYCFMYNLAILTFSQGETLKHNKLLALVLASFISIPAAYADSVVVYELKYPNGETIKQTISIDGRWLRLDTEPRGQSDYTLMDTGRLIKFDVNNQAMDFQVTRMGKLYWPQNPSTHPLFKPLKQTTTVAGLRCLKVNEMSPVGFPLAEHCMSPTGPLGLNAREMITLSRLFMTARRMNAGWPAVATPDERQVSIFSRADDGTQQRLLSVWHGKLPYTQFKIPVNYKRITPDLPDPSILPKLRTKPLTSDPLKKKPRYNQD
jgi:hypothetical protein